MARKNTIQGLLADRPDPIAATNTYYFTTDEGANHYYYSDGTSWRLQEPDLTEIDPGTEASLICGVDSNGAIQPFKISEVGAMQVSAASGTLRDLSGNVTQNNVSQQVAPANPDRKYFSFQNISNTDMYLGFGTAAVANKGFYVVKAGGSFSFNSGFVSTQQINVICSSHPSPFTALEG